MSSEPVRHRGRRALGWALATLITLVIAALLTDTVSAIRAEHSLARALLRSPTLEFEPEVTISGFPFLPQARNAEFSGAVITARGVAVPGCAQRGGCRAELGAALGEFTSDDWLIGPGDVLHTRSVTAYTRLDSVNLGRLLNIIDLTVNTPAPADKPGGGGPGDGLLERTTGVLLTGTVPLGAPVSEIPPSASAYPGPTVTVSVTVDLDVVDGRLHIIPTGFYDGPEDHVDADVPAAQRDEVLAHFSRTLPRLPSPWDISPTTARSQGSDIVLTAATDARDLRPEEF